MSGNSGKHTPMINSNGLHRKMSAAQARNSHCGVEPSVSIMFKRLTMDAFWGEGGSGSPFLVWIPNGKEDGVVIECLMTSVMGKSYDEAAA